MAYLYRRPNGRIEIREAYTSDRGPRSRTLVSFRAPLEAGHFDRAEQRATRPLDRSKLRARAEELAIPVRETGADSRARALLAELRRGAALEPRLAALVMQALQPLPRLEIPDALAEVADWVGASDTERGCALRDVLRLYGTVADSRDPVRERPARPFPRFRSRAPELAS